MSQPVRCVVFDHDGTLVNSLPVVVKASNETMKAFGYAEGSFDRIVADMVYPTAPRLGRLAGVEDPELHQRMAECYGKWALEHSGLAVLYPGIEALLASLEARGVPQAVVSNSQRIFIETILTRLGIAGHFAALVGECDMPAPKPDPTGLLDAIRAAGASPREAIFVGDSRTDLETARQAGVRAIGVTWGAHTRPELEVLGFDALVDRPEELLTLLP